MIHGYEKVVVMQFLAAWSSNHFVDTPYNTS
jgi:hypothetical protein